MPNDSENGGGEGTTELSPEVEADDFPEILKREKIRLLTERIASDEQDVQNGCTSFVLRLNLQKYRNDLAKLQGLPPTDTERCIPHDIKLAVSRSEYVSIRNGLAFICDFSNALPENGLPVAERIVATYNAAQGIHTDRLEPGMVQRLLAEVEALREMRKKDTDLFLDLWNERIADCGDAYCYKATQRRLAEDGIKAEGDYDD